MKGQGHLIMFDQWTSLQMENKLEVPLRKGEVDAF